MALPSEMLVNVLSPASTLLSGFKAKHVKVPGALGYLGIMPGHAPFMSGLVSGEMTIESGSGESKKFSITGGFVEVIGDQVTVLADSAKLLA